jgi:methanethiol S-methyltransferase
VILLDQRLASEVRERFSSHLEKQRVRSDHPTSVPKQNSRPIHGDTKKDLGRRISVFLYGLVCYAMFFGTFLYAVGFIGNLFVPKSIDSSPQEPLLQALLINVLLLGAFAVQHSLMARPFFKERWTKIVPKEAERSTYVLFSSLALILMFWQWQPMGGVIWDVHDPVARGLLLSLFGLGWLLVLASTFLINHFDLFGLRQVTLYLLGREYTRLPFKTPGLYKFVRHPLYVGWLFTFWATPTMTAAHLVFALATTAYILIAIQWEERDLVDEHGRVYENYRRNVPMLIPTGKKNDAAVEEALG